MKLFPYLIILLSFTATSPAVAKYAKTGCPVTCGNNVTIPFPFGIGANCAINQWYIVDCKNAMPYLSAFNHTEVLGVNLEDQTVTVSTPRITGCQNLVQNNSHTMSMNLTGSPFLFSISGNKFVFEGCGTATMTTDDGSVVTRCSTTCLNNVTFSSDRNNCFGNGCCQTAIPRYLRSYSINISGMGDQGEDRACGSAFLVDQTNSYNQRSWFSDPFIYRNASFVPVSLLWTLTDSDQFTCCSDFSPERRKVDVFNGMQVDTFKCFTPFASLSEYNPYLKDGYIDYVQTPKYAKTGCNDTCGNNVTIPFPFGIVLIVQLTNDLENRTITVDTPRITDCRNPVQNSSEIMGVDLGVSPFMFSRYNRFVFQGCETLNYAKKDCSDSCGDVTIPYPFGIGANCSVNEWYVVDCNSSTPYLSAFKNMKVLNVNLKEQTVRINVPGIVSRCQNSAQENSNHIPSIDLGNSPFLFSGKHNMFRVEGCGFAALLNDGKVIAGCSTTCTNYSYNIETHHCIGLGCCLTQIYGNLKSYSMDLTGLNMVDEDGACGSAFLGESRLSPIKRTGNGYYANTTMTLIWYLTDNDFHEIPNCWEPKSRPSYLALANGSSIVLRKCSCDVGRVGNPYLHYQCEEYVGILGEPVTIKKQIRIILMVPAGGKFVGPLYIMIKLSEAANHHLALFWVSNTLCVNCLMISISSSFRQAVFEVFTLHLVSNCLNLFLVSLWNMLAFHLPLSGVSICMGLLFLAKFIYELHKLIKKTIAKRQKEKFFKRNGGLLFKQQEATKEGLVDTTILFTSNELETATDHFNENRIIGRGGQGTVYKGMLADGRIVAVKKAKIVDECQLEQFINEVVILSQVNHRNVVKLLGCCLETEVPLLVSEFVSKGTLYDHIQDNTGELPFSLNMRLQIATEADNEGSSHGVRRHDNVTCAF
ncbi:hypothetical protein E3N88_01482 [Mikania micrantha]|uniref:Protein kinase domain-containing protein n=1 Tax=Mikania micrantha TaxID=192012 RepID=A0A5N6Q2P3_9ASTR|nr:hypothetical protein E3N88_01482 [Mikania micrantha]